MDEVVRNHSNEPAALVIAVRGVGDKAATTEDHSATVAGSKAAGGRVLHARRGAVAAAVAGQLLPRGSCNCKVEASVQGPGHGGDGSGGGAGVLLMQRDAASRLLPYSVSCVVVV